jgi:predicted dehydrogenase
LGLESVKNIGILGLGKMGILHSGIVNSLPDARVKAICENQRLLVRLAKPLLPKTIALYTDYVKMMKNEQLDAVFVTTPIATHLPLVVDLARMDRDVSLFVEKPLAASGHQAEKACEVARELRGVHMVGFQKRFSPVFQRAKRLIDAGSLGDLMFFRASSFSSDVLREGASWRFGRGTGGVLLDLAPHLLDLLIWLFGDPSSVLAMKRRVYSTKVDDYIHAVMAFKSGLKGHMDACWSVRGYRLPELWIEVHAREGTITVTDDFVRLEKASGPAETYFKQSFNTSVSFLLADPEYTMEDEAFMRGMQDHALPESNFFEAARVCAVIDRIIESAEEHRY